MPEPKTAEQLQAEIDLRDCLARERKESDAAYAAKIVERIVYGVIALFTAAVITGLATVFFSRFR